MERVVDLDERVLSLAWIDVAQSVAIGDASGRLLIWRPGSNSVRGVQAQPGGITTIAVSEREDGRLFAAGALGALSDGRGVAGKTSCPRGLDASARAGLVQGRLL